MASKALRRVLPTQGAGAKRGDAERARRGTYLSGRSGGSGRGAGRARTCGRGEGGGPRAGVQGGERGRRLGALPGNRRRGVTGMLSALLPPPLPRDFFPDSGAVPPK